MAVVPMRDGAVSQITDRLNKIGPDTQRKWGTMRPIDLMAHLRKGVEISLGKHEVKDTSIPVVRTLIRWVIFDSPLVWPKGKIKAPPVFLQAPEGDFATEKKRLLDAIQEFVNTEKREPGRLQVNPFLGPLPLKTWAGLHGKHFDHHLRQFGV